jgi:hypothetical protein
MLYIAHKLIFTLYIHVYVCMHLLTGVIIAHGSADGLRLRALRVGCRGGGFCVRGGGGPASLGGGRRTLQRGAQQEPAQKQYMCSISSQRKL